MARFEVGYTTQQAEGAWPNGSRVRKNCQEPGDAHAAGAMAKVLGSLGADGMLAYFVEWDDMPGLPVGVMASKLDLVLERVK